MTTDKDYKPVQLRFGDKKEQIRYEKVLDIIYNDNMPPRSRAFVIKELLLLAVNTGVTLEEVLTGKIHTNAHTSVSKEEPKEQHNSTPKVSKGLADMA